MLPRSTFESKQLPRSKNRSKINLCCSCKVKCFVGSRQNPSFLSCAVHWWLVGRCRSWGLSVTHCTHFNANPKRSNQCPFCFHLSICFLSLGLQQRCWELEKVQGLPAPELHRAAPAGPRSLSLLCCNQWVCFSFWQPWDTSPVFKTNISWYFFLSFLIHWDRLKCYYLPCKLNFISKRC